MLRTSPYRLAHGPDQRAVCRVGRTYAVWCDGELELYNGKNNLGEASLFHLGEQRLAGNTVRGISPYKLPPCDLLKLDVEGAETGILVGYPHLERCRAVVLEWHGDRNFAGCLNILRHCGFAVDYNDTMPGRGIMRAVK